MQDVTTPLIDTTFAVVDLETTGLTPGLCQITEIGALKFVAGERVGTFQSLVDPGVEVPPGITAITGIDSAMVSGAPPVSAVLPSLLEFVGDAVIVGHNVAFDLRFLHADLVALDYLPMTNGYVDTLPLARRLVADEVSDCRLGTLAHHFGTTSTPDHRAFADAAATAELFHSLVERLTSFGVRDLDDLLAFSCTGGHPDRAKLRWTRELPRASGVFELLGRGGDVLYVGWAADLRVEVRGLFEHRKRSGVWSALHLATSMTHEVIATEPEALVVATRRIEEHRPRFNRPARVPRRAPSGGGSRTV